VQKLQLWLDAALNSLSGGAFPGPRASLMLSISRNARSCGSQFTRMERIPRLPCPRHGRQSGAAAGSNFDVVFAWHDGQTSQLDNSLDGSAMSNSQVLALMRD